MEATNRITWIDLAKGLLILAVIFHHIHMHGYIILHETRVSAILDRFDDYWVIWFMPCFFMITGLCSNFNRDFPSFISSSLKTLILPNCILGFLYLLLYQSTVGGGYYLHECKMFLIRDLPNGGYFWFLSSLFVCKMLYYIIYNCWKERWKYPIAIIAIAILFSLIGYFWGKTNIPNIWYFKQAFIYLPVLSIGVLLKQNCLFGKSFRYYLPCFAITLLCIIVARYYHWTVPYVSYAFNYSNESVLPLLLLSAIGSYGFIGLCKRLGNFTLLVYIGKNSLVFYITHILIIQIVFTYSLSLPIYDFWIAMCVYVFCFIAVLLLGSLCSWCLNRKYICIALGKF